MLIAHSCAFLGAVSLQVLCPFFFNCFVRFAVVEVRGSLYILDTNPFSDLCFADLSHSIGSLFIPWIVSSDAQNVFHFHQACFVCFFLVFPGPWSRIQEIITKSNVVKFLPYVFF